MNVRLEYDMHWRAAIWFENTLQINNYNLELAITTNTTNPDDHVVSLSRLNHFVYNEMANMMNLGHISITKLIMKSNTAITKMCILVVYTWHEFRNDSRPMLGEPSKQMNHL